MKKLLIAFILGFVLLLAGCSKHEGIPQEANGTTEDFEVTFLFECNGVEIYRFKDCGHVRYFAVGNGTVMTKQKQVHKNGKSTHAEYWDDSVIKVE